MRRVGAVVLLMVSPALALALLQLTGALGGPEIVGLPDPGRLTRYGLPVVQATRDVAAILTVGLLVVACCCLAPMRRNATEISGAHQRLADLAVASGIAWAWAGLSLLALTYADIAGVSPGSPGFAAGVWFFAQNFDLGRYLLASAFVGGAIAVGGALVRTLGGVALLAVIALAGLWPMALTGHAVGVFDHNTAVDLQAWHLAGIAVWVGGLAALTTIHRGLGWQLVPAVRRFSTLAGGCLVVVAGSGVLGAVLRLDADELLSSYGGLVALKVLFLAMLAGAGWWHRRRLVSRMAAGVTGQFWRLVVAELAVMAAATGTGVALSRSDPPGESLAGTISAAESVLGARMPPAPGLLEWFTQWRLDAIWLPVAAFMAAWYVRAWWRLRSRGDRWSVLRLVAWLFGWLLLVWAAAGAPGVYGRVMFSMHMVQHMTIATAVPAFLVLGAPVTLALRTLPRRRDGSRGPREWILTVVHSPVAGVLGHPLVAAGLFVVSLVTFYYTSLFELTLRTHTGHLLMTLHFVLTGYLFVNALVGIDPGPRRPAFPFRALLLMVTFGFHALFSVTLMASSTILAEGWFGLIDRPWGATLARDQYVGAQLSWALGDYPLLILGGALIVAWVGADGRERRRFDRREKRNDGASLAAYNAYLASLDQGSRGRAARQNGKQAVPRMREPDGKNGDAT
jgi:cytochrome c oxidase assembly factor CtaG/putative copper export protein